MDSIFLYDTGVNNKLSAARNHLGSQRQYLDQIKNSIDALTADWDGGAEKAYADNLYELGQRAREYLEEIAVFLGEVDVFSKDYAHADRKGKASAKTIVVSPSHLRDIAGKLGTANKALDNAKRYLNNANSSSTWTCPQRSEVIGKINDCIKGLGIIQRFSEVQSENLRKTADMFDDVTANVSGAETRLKRRLCESSGIKVVSFFGRVVPDIVITVLPADLFIKPPVVPGPALADRIISLRNGEISLNGGN